MFALFTVVFRGQTFWSFLHFSNFYILVTAALLYLLFLIACIHLIQPIWAAVLINVYLFNVMPRCIISRNVLHRQFASTIIYTVQTRREPQRGPGNILAGPVWGEHFSIFFKWCILVYFIFLSDGEAPPPQTSRGPK